MKRLPQILCFAALHFVVGLLAFYMDWSRGWRHFDLGDIPTPLDRVIHFATVVLWSPFHQLRSVFGMHGGSSMEVFGPCLNSLLWGVAFSALITVLRRPIRPQSPNHALQRTEAGDEVFRDGRA